MNFFLRYIDYRVLFFLTGILLLGITPALAVIAMSHNASRDLLLISLSIVGLAIQVPIISAVAKAARREEHVPRSVLTFYALVNEFLALLVLSVYWLIAWSAGFGAE